MKTEEQIKERLNKAKEFNSTHKYGYWHEIPDAFAQKTAYNEFIRVRHEEYLLEWILNNESEE